MPVFFAQHKHLRVRGIDQHEPEVSEVEVPADGLDRRLQDLIQAEPTGDQTTDAIDDGDAHGAALRRVGGMLEQAHQDWSQLTLATDCLDNRR